jgi:hypothetical protein
LPQFAGLDHRAGYDANARHLLRFQAISSPPTTGVNDPRSFLKCRRIIAARKPSKGESCP